MNPVPISRERSLLFLFLSMAIFFVLTGFAVRSFYAKQNALAREWSDQGEAALRAGSFEAAVQRYQTALTYSRDNTSYQLRLAQALLGDNRFPEAKAYLETLWEHEPGDGIVNLELARLAIRDQDFSSATDYFHNAIYGVWEKDQESRRREARLELIQMLLGRGLNEEAQGELIALAADLPNDAALHTQVGELFLKTEAYNRALQEFRLALQLSPNSEPALAGAGEAAFRMQDYTQAERYLKAAVRVNPGNSDAAAKLGTASLVLDLDASAMRLSSTEKANRILRGFDLASKRLENCLPGQPEGSPGSQALSTLQSRTLELKPKMRLATLRRDSDLETATMELIDSIEVSTPQYCGQPTGGDLALLLLANRREGNDR